MTPLRTKMIRDMQLQRLAPRTHEASVAAVTALAAFSHCAPDRLHPEQIRGSLCARGRWCGPVGAVVRVGACGGGGVTGVRRCCAAGGASRRRSRARWALPRNCSAFL